MEMKLKKLWPLVGAICVGLFSSANAAYQTNGSSGSTYNSNMDSSMQSGQSTYQRGTFRDITPAAGPRVAHGADVFLTADFIYWKATQDGLSVTDLIGSSIITPNFKWEPGFKVGLGLNLSHDGWDVYAQYTWLHSSSHKNATSGDWHLHFNVIDLELGRNFYVSQFLTIRPHFGLKGTWQEQGITGASTAYTTFLATQKQDTWGLGISSGLNTAWHFTTSWSIFGDIAWSAMWTHYNAATTDFSPSLKLKGDNYRIRNVAEFELGLRWETWFYDDNYHLAIEAGWEEQIWSNYGSFIRLSNDGQSDLSLHGLNLKFRFDF